MKRKVKVKKLETCIPIVNKQAMKRLESINLKIDGYSGNGYVLGKGDSIFLMDTVSNLLWAAMSGRLVAGKEK